MFRVLNYSRERLYVTDETVRPEMLTCVRSEAGYSFDVCRAEWKCSSLHSNYPQYRMGFTIRSLQHPVIIRNVSGWTISWYTKVTAHTLNRNPIIQLAATYFTQLSGFIISKNMSHLYSEGTSALRRVPLFL
jgi:hypothetical protein